MSNCFLNIEFRAVDVDECSSFPCQNDGNCTDDVDSYTCECQPGFWGVDCETGNDYFLEFSKKCSNIPSVWWHFYIVKDRWGMVYQK